MAWVLHVDRWSMSRGPRGMPTCVEIREDWLASYRARIIKEGGYVLAVYRIKPTTKPKERV